MRRRGCLISFGALAGLSLVCCVLLIFVGWPRLQDQIAGGISDGLSTEVAQQIGVEETDLQPGTYTISMTELERQLNDTGATEGVDDIEFSAQNGEIILSIGSQGQSFGYSAVPVAEDGQLVLTEVAADGGLPDWLFPTDKLAEAVEDGVNSYFEARDLDIAGVTAENDELVVETVEAGA